MNDVRDRAYQILFENTVAAYGGTMISYDLDRLSREATAVIKIDTLNLRRLAFESSIKEMWKRMPDLHMMDAYRTQPFFNAVHGDTNPANDNTAWDGR